MSLYTIVDSSLKRVAALTQSENDHVPELCPYPNSEKKAGERQEDESNQPSSSFWSKKRHCAPRLKKRRDADVRHIYLALIPVTACHLPYCPTCLLHSGKQVLSPAYVHLSSYQSLFISRLTFPDFYRLCLRARGASSPSMNTSP